MECVEGLLVWTKKWSGIIQHRKGDGFHHSGYKLAMAGALYHVWIERNARIFHGVQRDVKDVLRVVVTADLRSYFSSWTRIKRSAKNQELCAKWNLSPCIFVSL